MKKASPRWRVGGWSNLKRFEMLTLSSLYPLFCLPTLAIITWSLESGFQHATAAQISGTVIAIIAAVVAAAVGCSYLHLAVNEKPIPARVHVLNATVFLGAAATFIGATALKDALRWFSLLLVLVQGISMYAAQFKTFLVALNGIAVSVAGAFMIYLQIQDQEMARALAIWGTIFALTLAYGVRISVWMIAVTRQLDRARITQAELAVAEERLRFSRDLHDVFGRTLSVVSVKSELAAALAQRHDERAVTEMMEVRKIAADALEEVRAVVQGYRQISAPTEIAGASQLLRSAGITPEFDVADIDQWPDEVQELVAWFIREGITNVVRHSQATYCRVHLEHNQQRYRVVMMNDGVARVAQDNATTGGGTGLIGLAERLGCHGGLLSWRHLSDEGVFMVEMGVPEKVAA